ncbi:hypothetical protein UFOVP1516_75 [uncultured Caudovirales phage]|uniref:Phage protein n=1 Tax=uncultured Caudovirales phage TaxID=2100421 RepID=A0A6J7X807_9CAUD|nr:hypothetical protein UFOVP887_60 [uncultured Caudovirales phage]CAB5226953.1 hypothetical protein UFOVP1516_75 [uncultured Caudovirales phage]
MSYLKNQATANKLLKKFGQSMILTSKSSGTYNTTTGSLSVSETTQNIIGVVFEWGSFDRPIYGMEFSKDSLIQVMDQQLIISAVGIIPPNLGDTVLIQGKQYTIVPPLKHVAPAGITVVIVCNIRGV